jgi:2-polyprenyl-3-methyl-5-hydroxy-6-metoxy-1,4-benzoquinol methylase
VDRKQHWSDAYTKRGPDRLSWYQLRPALSLELIEKAGMDPKAGAIDVGGGASSLVDELLERGFENLAVLDVAGLALELAQARLGDRADRVEWIEADVTQFEPQHHWGLWHDRAVFHFLTEASDRKAYLRALEAAVAPGGFAVISAFSLAGPKRCSGLGVVRYSPETLAQELGPGFESIEARDEVHVTPTGGEQSFTYCLLRRV